MYQDGPARFNTFQTTGRAQLKHCATLVSSAQGYTIALIRTGMNLPLHRHHPSQHSLKLLAKILHEGTTPNPHLKMERKGNRLQNAPAIQTQRLAFAQGRSCGYPTEKDVRRAMTAHFTRPFQSFSRLTKTIMRFCCMFAMHSLLIRRAETTISYMYTTHSQNSKYTQTLRTLSHTLHPPHHPFPLTSQKANREYSYS
jgi:hypothetical protein